MSYRYDSSLIAGSFVFGVGSLGVLAEDIPSTGDSGPSFLFSDLVFPADNGKEICGTITTWPTYGVLVANEDGSFNYSGAPDGSHSFGYQLKVDGAPVGPETFEYIQVGSVPVTIPCNVGSAVDIPLSATVSSPQTVQCAQGAASALGLTASVYSDQLIASGVGLASATGLSATIATGQVITCSVGTSSATGYQANVASAQTLVCSSGVASASGLQASLVSGQAIGCLTGTANATGAQASIISAQNIECSVAVGSATGITALITSGQAVACNLGVAAASSSACIISSAVILPCAVATADAQGLTASVEITIAGTIACGVGQASALGEVATIISGVTGWTLSESDVQRIAVAVLAALRSASPVVPVNTVEMNGAQVHGTGTQADKWRGNV